MNSQELEDLLKIKSSRPDVTISVSDIQNTGSRENQTLFFGEMVNGNYLHTFYNHKDCSIHRILYSKELSYIESSFAKNFSARDVIPDTCFADECDYKVCKAAISKGFMIDFVENKSQSKPPLFYEDFKSGGVFTLSSSIENHVIRRGLEWAYDRDECHNATPADSFAIVAVRAIMSCLTDRRGIKNPLLEVEYDDRVKLVKMLAEIVSDHQDDPKKAVLHIITQLKLHVSGFRSELDTVDDDVISEMVETFCTYINESKKINLPVVIQS